MLRQLDKFVSPLGLRQPPPEEIVLRGKHPTPLSGQVELIQARLGAPAGTQGEPIVERRVYLHRCAQLFAGGPNRTNILHG